MSAFAYILPKMAFSLLVCASHEKSRAITQQTVACSLLAQGWSVEYQATVDLELDAEHQGQGCSGLVIQHQGVTGSIA